MNMTRDVHEFWTIIITTFVLAFIIFFIIIGILIWIQGGVDDSDFYKE